MTSNASPPRAFRRGLSLRWWIIILLCIGALIYFASDYLINYTDDAYVRSDFVPIACQVDGIVQSVAVTDNQFVKTGDLLFHIDPEPYRLTLALKQDRITAAVADMEEKMAAATVIISQIESARATLQLAQEDYDRVKPFVSEQALPQTRLDQATDVLHRAQDHVAKVSSEASVARQQVDMAKTAVGTAKAEQAIAAYALSRTEIKAPVNGYVTNLTLRPGVYAKAGSPLIGIVDINRFRVIANFKEYVAASLKPGKRVWIWLDSHPWRLFHGRVKSVGRGIARNETPGALLPYVAPTTDWIRLLRRLPVIIDFDPPVAQSELYMGADARVLIIR
jgi:membrane fusion protein, multidrug efflux system